MTGELISLGVALSWTVTAMVSEVASKRMGVIPFNVWRLALALICSIALSVALTGSLMPAYADGATWAWMMLSGLVGYFFGDWCLFNGYLIIGSRYGQLFMTLAPVASALSAWAMLGETMTLQSIIAMVVVVIGIAIAVSPTLSFSDICKLSLPPKGVLFAIGAAVGQGLGLVLSKVGMEYYEANIPTDAASEMANIIPFNANLIRCIAGVACFTLWTMIRGEHSKLLIPLHDRRSLASTLTAVCFGPFLGVGFSLMAVQLTSAGIAQTLMATTPIIILLPSWYFFKQKITTNNIIGAVVSVAGASLFFI